MYNLCIHNVKTNTSKSFVWDETKCGRGSIEIVSCRKLWLDEVNEKGKFSDLVLFSDSCSGQYKNINMIMFYLRELTRKYSSLFSAARSQLQGLRQGPSLYEILSKCSRCLIMLK